MKESLEKEEDDPADENAVKVLWVNPQMPLQIISDSIFIRISEN